MKTGLPLMRNILTQLATSLLASFRLTEAALAIDAAIHKRTFQSDIGNLKQRNDDIIKIVNFLEDAALLI